MTILPLIIRAPINLDELRNYAKTSGDRNPIHRDASAAHSLGFDGVIAHGMLMMGIASQAIESWFFNEKLSLFKVRFLAPTYEKEHLMIKGSFDYKAKPQIGQIEIMNTKGEKKLAGHFRFEAIQV